MLFLGMNCAAKSHDVLPSFTRQLLLSKACFHTECVTNCFPATGTKDLRNVWRILRNTGQRNDASLTCVHWSLVGHTGLVS